MLPISFTLFLQTFFQFYIKFIFKETDGSEKDVLVSGRKMIAAGYALYGSATVIVLSFGDAPSMFMLGLFFITTIILMDSK